MPYANSGSNGRGKFMDLVENRLDEMAQRYLHQPRRVDIGRRQNLQNTQGNKRRAMPKYAYHVTSMANAESILTIGSHPGFSVTGSLSEAKSFVVAYSRHNKEDTALLRVKTKYIKNETTGDQYTRSATEGYFEVTHHMPPAAFELIGETSWDDIKGEKRKWISILRPYGLDRRDYRVGEYRFSRPARNALKLVKEMERNGWKVMNKDSSSWHPKQGYNWDSPYELESQKKSMRHRRTGMECTVLYREGKVHVNPRR